MRKVYKTGKEAREETVKGMNIVADSVCMALGPHGRNAIIGLPYQDPLITNDGKEIADSFTLDDEIQELGCQVIKAGAKNANDTAQEGRKTTVCLIQAITNSAMEKMSSKNSFIDSTVDSIALRKEIKDSCDKAVKLLEKKAIKVKGKQDLINIATASSENKEIGTIVGELFEKIGKDGVVTIEDNHLFGIETELVEGLEIENGFVSPQMATHDKEAIVEKPYILMTNEKIGGAAQIKPIIAEVCKSSKTLIIFCEHIEKEIVVEMVVNKLSNVFSCIVIKLPAGKPEVMEDIQTLVGGEVIDLNKGLSLKETKIEQLGRAEKIIVDKDKTLIVDGKGDVKSKIKQLKEEHKAADSLYVKNNLEKRIAKLSGGVAIIRVGAESDRESKYLKNKIKDAVSATKLALQEGYVKGGGIALKEVAEELGDTIITEALKAPYEKIQKNAGGKLDIPNNIIDAVKVLKYALTNACSEASMFITIELAVNDKNEEPKSVREE